MKAVFDTKPTSIYDDDVSQHYHFPQRYAALVEKCVGDWVVLRRPRADGGNLAYFATARVWRVEPDSARERMSYARLTNYMEFDSVVAWRLNGRYAEDALRSIPRQQVGVYLRGRSVRLISDEDFVNLISIGLKETFDPQVAEGLGLPRGPFDDIDLSAQEVENEGQVLRVRRLERALVNRVVRDSNFRRSVGLAYDYRCSISGLRIFDWRGHAEAQAAHIWPVTGGGPDIVQNGIALSGTLHWLFDRHLISLTDDCRLLICEERIPATLRALLVGEGDEVYLPCDRSRRPRPRYIAMHRRAFLERNAGR